MCQQVSEVCGIDAHLLWTTFMVNGLGKEYELGHLTTEDLFAYLSSIASLPYTKDQLFVAFSNIFEINESILPVIKKLKEKEIRLVLLSNISEMHMNFITEKYPFLSEFDHATLSYQVNAMKPQEKIFRAVLESANCRPDECFYTDDIEEYITAAKKLGIDGETFTGTSQLLSHLEQRGIIL